MENKYYTPEIVDIKVGYECEIFNSNSEWFPITITLGHIFNDLLFYTRDISKELNGLFRTKYLDKQDIESLGWKFNYLGKDDWFKGNLTIIAYNEIDYPFELWFKLDKYWLGFYKGVYKIVIIEKREGFPNNEIIRFSGNCPSINELKYIQKLLGIK